MIFAPLAQLARLWRALIAYIDGLGAILTDDTLAHELDDPYVRAYAERYIIMAEDGIAILTTQRPRELLGLPFQRIETRQPGPLTHPRSRESLMARHARMLASLGSIERAAQKRAVRIRREAQQSPLRLDAPHRSTSPSLQQLEAIHRSLASPTPQEWGRLIARPCAQDGGARVCTRPAFTFVIPESNPRALRSHVRGRAHVRYPCTAVLRAPATGGVSTSPAKHCAFDIQFRAFAPTTVSFVSPIFRTCVTTWQNSSAKPWTSSISLGSL